MRRASFGALFAALLGACSGAASNPGEGAGASGAGSGGGGAGACDEGHLDCDGDSANGCEVDATSDPEHCGSCARNCAGGTCDGGTCGVATLYEDESFSIGALALDATSIYFTTYPGGCQAQSPEMGVSRIPKRGGSVTALAHVEDASCNQSMSLAIDDTDAFFGATAGPIYRVSKDGGSPTPLVDYFKSAGQQGIALDSTGVYFTAPSNLSGTGSIFRVPKSGGVAALIWTQETQDDYVMAIVADPAGLDWLTYDDQIKQRRFGGQSATTLVQLPQTGSSPAASLALDGGELFSFSNVADPTIYAIKSSGRAVPIATRTKAPLLAAGAGLLYYATAVPDAVDLPPDDTELWEMKVDGSAPRKIAVGPINGIVVGDDAVYWAESSDHGKGTLKVLVR